MPSDEFELWKRILKIPSIEEQMQKKGFALSSESFRKITSSFGAQMKLRAPEYLSKDFWSRQPAFLVERGLYVLRTGVGRFALVNEKVFPKPYLSLQPISPIELNARIPQSFKPLKRAFDENAQENAALEQMRFLGIFEQLIVDLFGTREYIVGPRGNRGSSFDVFLEKNNHEKVKLFTYKGQEELDYSLRTEENALLFEAKQTNQLKGFLDPEWHKLTYSANRFRDYNVSLFPVYFLRRQNEILVFVFPKIQFYQSGIIINDSQAMTPKRIYRAKV